MCESDEWRYSQNINVGGDLSSFIEMPNMKISTPNLPMSEIKGGKSTVYPQTE